MNSDAVDSNGRNAQPTFTPDSLSYMSFVPKNSDMASNDSNPQKFNNITSECEASIQSVIDSHIIPRLLNSKSLRLQDENAYREKSILPTPWELLTFSALTIAESPLLAQAFIDQILAKGMSREIVFLELITPAARILGRQWESEEIDFLEVTHGLIRLQSITHAIGYANQHGPLASGEVKRVMIASAPGSEHLLGASIVSEFFRKASWEVVLEISPSPNELVQVVHREWFDAIGLSVSIHAQLQGLKSLISNLRNSSLNPRPVVLLGGPIFTVMDLKANDFGADGISVDANEAVFLANSLQTQA
jgi:MerR family transcriptional regulator, light-induced transcriptional regulator